MKKNIILTLLLSSFFILMAYAIPPRYYNKPKPKEDIHENYIMCNGKFFIEQHINLPNNESSNCL